MPNHCFWTSLSAELFEVHAIAAIDLPLQKSDIVGNYVVEKILSSP